MKVHPYATVLPLLAAGLLTTACGSSSSPSAGSSSSPKATPTFQTVATVVPAMQAAVKEATSVHIAGTVLDGSKQLSLDVSFQGGGMSGTVGEGGQTYTILLVAHKAYFKVDAAFLKAAGVPAADCSRVCGKYVLVPTSQVAQLSGSLSMSGFTSQWVNSLPSSVAHDTTEHFTPATFDGQPVLTAAQGPYTLDVDASGPPYPLFISESAQGSITFSQWNSVPTLTRPRPRQVVSPSNL